MIEAVPSTPYNGFTNNIKDVEHNMVLRRAIISHMLDHKKGQYLFSIPIFPLMGSNNDQNNCNGPIANSNYISDDIIAPHPRFATLTKNIRLRRQSKVKIQVPLYIDKNTKLNKNQKNIIEADAMAFGMGCNCLQVTFNTADLKEARYLYDQLIVLAPLLLSLTAASPFFKGQIMNHDTRWSIVSQSVDDRTEEERNINNKQKYIHKSRYASCSTYLSSQVPIHYNDLNIQINQEMYHMLKKHNIDDLMAKHIAHLFIRDPLAIYEELVELDDMKTSNHFENIQSTNWQSVRFKPPNLENLSMGYRVELRTMEVQLTDYENAAFTVFVALLSRAILYYNCNFYIPISQVDLNFISAEQRNSIHSSLFYFKNNENIIDLYSLKDIFLGNDKITGLISLVYDYIEIIKPNDEIKQLIYGYITLIKQRLTGQLYTLATWCRKYVAQHDQYLHDSHLNSDITSDLLRTLCCINHGNIFPMDLLPSYLYKSNQKVIKLDDTINKEKGEKVTSPASSPQQARQDICPMSKELSQLLTQPKDIQLNDRLWTFIKNCYHKNGNDNLKRVSSYMITKPIE